MPAPCPTCRRVFVSGEIYCPFDRSPLQPAAITPAAGEASTLPARRITPAGTEARPSPPPTPRAPPPDPAPPWLLTVAKVLFSLLLLAVAGVMLVQIAQSSKPDPAPTDSAPSAANQVLEPANTARPPDPIPVPAAALPAEPVLRVTPPPESPKRTPRRKSTAGLSDRQRSALDL